MLTCAQLCDIALEQGASVDYSPLGLHRYLLVRLDASAGNLSAGERDRIAAWVRRQACPAIALSTEGSDSDHPIAQACDVVVSGSEQLPQVLETIEHAPIAAMTLVQVLRCTRQLPIEQALTVESLAFSALQAGPEFKRWLVQRKSLPHAGAPAPKSSEAVHRDAAVCVDRHGEFLDLRLNRPERLNALSSEMRDALVEALELAAMDQSVRAIRISGEGRAFCAGGDLDEFGEAPDPAIAHAIRSVRLPAAALVHCAPRVSFLVHGACIGAGMELAAFGARVLAKPDAFFQLPEIRFGLIPGAGGCVSIPRRIGRQRTAYLALSACRLDASTALEWGLIDEVVAAE